MLTWLVYVLAALVMLAAVVAAILGGLAARVTIRGGKKATVGGKR